MMSWLSCSSPVSAEKPRYETEGILMFRSSLGVMEKQEVHARSDLYCKSRERRLSWK